MPRARRITIPALPHDIIQRGNNRQAIFFDDEDYRLYLQCLRQAKDKCACRIYAYVLMTNHVHLLVEPTRERDLATRCSTRTLGMQGSGAARVKDSRRMRLGSPRKLRRPSGTGSGRPPNGDG